MIGQSILSELTNYETQQMQKVHSTNQNSKQKDALTAKRGETCSAQRGKCAAVQENEHDWFSLCSLLLDKNNRSDW